MFSQIMVYTNSTYGRLVNSSNAVQAETRNALMGKNEYWVRYLETFA